jgi:hypothetical protein
MAKTTLVGTDTININDGLPMAYMYRDGIVRGLQRVHPAKVDAMFHDCWAEFSFKEAGISLKKGICAYDKERVLLISPKGLTDKEKLDLAKQLGKLLVK